MPHFSRLLFLKQIQRHMHSIYVWDMIKQSKPLQARSTRVSLLTGDPNILELSPLICSESALVEFQVFISVLKLRANCCNSRRFPRLSLAGRLERRARTNHCMIRAMLVFHKEGSTGSIKDVVQYISGVSIFAGQRQLALLLLLLRLQRQRSTRG